MLIYYILYIVYCIFIYSLYLFIYYLFIHLYEAHRHETHFIRGWSFLIPGTRYIYVPTHFFLQECTFFPQYFWDPPIFFFKNADFFLLLHFIFRHNLFNFYISFVLFVPTGKIINRICIVLKYFVLY